MSSILDLLREQVVLADGAMGSRLFELGAPSSSCFDILNLESPSLVREVHEQYVQAGSRLIETNTFGASGIKLDQEGLAAEMAEINRQGAFIAKRAAGEGVFVAGSMGPVGRLDTGREQGTAITPEDIMQTYADQARALAEGGVDCLMLETFPRLDQLLLALKGVLSEVDLPVIAQMVFTKQGRTIDGLDARTCFEAMAGAGAHVVGLNCGTGPHGVLSVLKSTPDRGKASGLPLSVFPNAGFPEKTGDRLLYSSSPEYFADTVMQTVKLGARLVGGCCGTGPDHIRALGKRLDESKPESTVFAVPGIKPPAQPEQTVSPSEFASNLGKKKMILVELDPPKHLDPSQAMEGARALAKAGVDAITVAENPLALPRLSNTVLASMISRETRAETIVHLTGRDRNLVGMQSTIMGLAAQGLTNVLAVTGDPPPPGADDVVRGVFDLRSFELIELIKKFNQGRNHHGDDMRLKVPFAVGAAYNPNTKNKSLQVRRMEKKIENGADFFMTQPVYSRQSIDMVLELTSHIKVPIFLGIMPLASHRNAQFLHNEFPGITIPEDILRRMEKAGENGLAQGTEIAWELIRHAWDSFQGIYMIPPFNKYPVALDLIERLKKKSSGLSADLMDR